MMTLISLAIIVAFGTSLAATFGLFEIEVWWELASLITIMVLGHWLEMRAISQARGALNALAALLPDTAERVSGTETQTVPISELKVSDVVLVRPGTRVPADGTVVEGSADVDESMITGESRSVSKGPGGKVIAGTVAAGGSLRVRITAVGEQTALSGIMRLVAAAQASGSRTQDLADRAAAILFYVAVASGAITFAYWWLSGDKEHALIRTATVLIIACPHALGLAIPLVIAISTSIGAQNGLLVKDRLALERARNLDMVIFDKTGTLTRGSPALSGIATAPGGNENDLLADAAAVEANSEHPLAKAIVNEAKRRNLPTLQAANFEALPGRGAQAVVNGRGRAVRRGPGPGPGPGRGRGHLAGLFTARGIHFNHAGRRPQAAAYYREAARLAGQAGDTAGLGRALLNLSDTVTGTDPAAGAEAARAAAAQLRRTGARILFATAVANLAQALLMTGWLGMPPGPSWPRPPTPTASPASSSWRATGPGWRRCAARPPPPRRPWPGWPTCGPAKTPDQATIAVAEAFTAAARGQPAAALRHARTRALHRGRPLLPDRPRAEGRLPSGRDPRGPAHQRYDGSANRARVCAPAAEIRHERRSRDRARAGVQGERRRHPQFAERRHDPRAAVIRHSGAGA